MAESKNVYSIGGKLRDLRLKNGLTQEELADRAELSKGYISQLENDLTSPSIATLIDVLTLLGSSLAEFFSDDDESKLVFTPEDYFEKKTEKQTVNWIVPTAQKNEMEPILIELEKGESTDADIPHEGGVRIRTRVRGGGVGRRQNGDRACRRQFLLLGGQKALYRQCVRRNKQSALGVVPAVVLMRNAQL